MDIIFTERDVDGTRLVYRNGFLVAAHGQFCTGCDATRGRCGRLTKFLTTWD